MPARKSTVPSTRHQMQSTTIGAVGSRAWYWYSMHQGSYFWTSPRLTTITKVDKQFNDFTNKCGLLRLHHKTSWIASVKNLQVDCQKQKMKRQVCNFSCDKGTVWLTVWISYVSNQYNIQPLRKGKRLVGTGSVTCYRDEFGIFLTDVERRPVCKWKKSTALYFIPPPKSHIYCT